MSISDALLTATNNLLDSVQQLLLGRILAARQTFKAETTNADPGTGAFRMNNATVSDVTELYFDDEDIDGTSLVPLLTSYDDSGSTSKGRLTLQDTTNTENWVKFKVTGTAVEETGYVRIPVEYIAHSGAFTADDVIAQSFTETGDPGTAPGISIGTITEGNPASVTLNGPDGNGDYTLDMVLPIGSTGPIGPQGPAGASIVMQAAVPDDAVGNDGDTWIDTLNLRVHGPKAAGEWPAGVSFKGATGPQGPAGPTGNTGPAGPTGPTGATGAAGADGAKLHATTGIPADGVGSDGDYAFDAAAGVGYGPKAGGTWVGTSFSTTGPVGPQGPQGLQGPTGLQGPQGATGPQGVTGPNGRTIITTTGAPANGTGENGDYAYDPAAKLMYGPKSGGTWPAAVTITGDQGPQGDIGPEGPRGRTWHSGAGAPSDVLGEDGDWYWNVSDSEWHGPKAAGTWPGAVSVIGATGPQGPQGLTGPEGPQGPAGTGNLDGPGSSTDNHIALFDGTTGQLIKDSGKTIAALLVDFTASIQNTLDAAIAVALVVGPRDIHNAAVDYTTFDFPTNTIKQLINTSTHTLDGVLPATPVSGTEVSFIDIGDFSANSFWIRRNGELIESLAEDVECNVQGQFATLRFVGGTVGWKVSAV
jgi:hypothetical protein